MRSFPAILASVLAAVTIVQAAPVSKNQGLDIPIEADGKVANYLSDEVLQDIANHTLRSKYARDTNDRRSGLESLTAPAIEGVVNPLATGLGRGVAEAASGTQQFADLLGDAIDTLFHTSGGVAANTEQGAGVAVANAGNYVQSTVSELQSNKGIIGDIVKTVGGSRRSLRSVTTSIKGVKKWWKKL